jgi:protein phosphatase
LNGDLAVSRGFGDRDYKKQGADKDDLENQPATASPEMGAFECDDADFLLLVCDGVSEGDFPNPEVVKFVADALKEGKDIAYTAQGVCEKAVDRNSKDNVTCMIVCLTGDGNAPEEGLFTSEYVPGPLSLVDNTEFLKCYAAMAAKRDLTLGQAVEKRYEKLEEELKVSFSEEAKEEKDRIGEPVGEKGSDERRNWFDDWANSHSKSDGGGGAPGGLSGLGGIPPALLQQLLASQSARQDPEPSLDGTKKVRTPALDSMKPAIDKHPALNWDERICDLCDSEGHVLQVDSSDGTTQVRFKATDKHAAMSAWLPSEILEEVMDDL